MFLIRFSLLSETKKKHSTCTFGYNKTEKSIKSNTQMGKLNKTLPVWLLRNAFVKNRLEWKITSNFFMMWLLYTCTYAYACGIHLYKFNIMSIGDYFDCWDLFEFKSFDSLMWMCQNFWQNETHAHLSMSSKKKIIFMFTVFYCVKRMVLFIRFNTWRRWWYGAQFTILSSEIRDSKKIYLA